MNKRNKILVGCLALLLVLSVGYALFSETITINGTATAKGSFDITSTCYEGDYYNIFHPEFDYRYKEGGYVDKICKANGNAVTISTELQYPSARRVYTVEMKNTGSMDAMLKFLKPTSSDYFPSSIGVADTDIKLYNKSDDSLYQSYGGTEPDIDLSNYGFSYIGDAFIVIKKEDGTFLGSDDAFIANDRLYKDSEGNNYLKVTPNESIIYFVISKWNEDAEETDYYSVVSATYETSFQQFTSDMTLDPDAELCIGGC